MKGLKMTDEDREEMHQDMLEEAREEELLEHKLRTDYDELCDYVDLSLLQEEYYRIKSMFEAYGWDFDLRDIV